MSSELRCLVSGDVKGQFSTLFKRVRSLQKKAGDFDLLLCVGDFFGNSPENWNEFSSGNEKVPISTLILGPNSSAHAQYYEGKDGEEMCHNVTFLGGRGRYTSSSGIQIAYLSGVDGSRHEKREMWHFTEEDVTALMAPVMSDPRYRGIDVLLTSQWPFLVDKYATTLKREPVNVSPLIGELARVLRPRYHFCGLNSQFYERQPYRNHKVIVENARHVTRFIGLAAVGNENKDKYLYAFTIKPMSKMTGEELNKQPQDATESPYSPIQLASKDNTDTEEGSQFFYDMTTRDSGGGGKRSGDGRDHENKRRKPPQPTGPCWFCLGSPEVEKHLVVSVGSQTYLALAKGGLVEDHVLILPIGHYQSYITSPSEVQTEIQSYMDSLRKYFRSINKAVVFYERNYRTQHLQIQVIPIPLDQRDTAKDIFMEFADSKDIELHEIPKLSDITQIVPAGAPYFYTELPCGGKLLHRISKHFPLQFAREVLAQPDLLNVEERIDWRNCSESKEESSELASNFKMAFKKFDFNFA